MLLIWIQHGLSFGSTCSFRTLSFVFSIIKHSAFLTWPGNRIVLLGSSLLYMLYFILNHFLLSRYRLTIMLSFWHSLIYLWLLFLNLILLRSLNLQCRFNHIWLGIFLLCHLLYFIGSCWWCNQLYWLLREFIPNWVQIEHEILLLMRILTILVQLVKHWLRNFHC